MKITVKKDVTSTVQDILIAILLVMCIVFAYDNVRLKEENDEIKQRYNIVQQEKMELLDQLNDEVV